MPLVLRPEGKTVDNEQVEWSGAHCQKKRGRMNPEKFVYGHFGRKTGPRSPTKDIRKQKIRVIMLP